MNRKNTRPSARILPFDIITSILLLLDPKSLVQFMCVCKSWRYLIRSEGFAARYLEESNSRNEDLILFPSERDQESIYFHLLNGKTNLIDSNLRIPFGSKWENIRIVGSSNGILCITEVEFFGFNIYLCNPSIWKYRVINSSTIPIWLVDDIILGFGFHSQANDYKVVRVAYGTFKQPVNNCATCHGRGIKRSDYDVRAEVYSLNTNSWKAVNTVDRSFPWYIYQTCSEVLVNESLHWLARDGGINGSEMIILAFNLREEKFERVELPPFEGGLGGDDNPNREFLGVLRGLLVVCDYFSSIFDLFSKSFDLWVMTDYKNANSWTRHDIIIYGIGIERPLKITNNGQIILLNDKHSVMIYRLESDSAHTLEIRAYQPSFVSFAKSLALINEINDLRSGTFSTSAVSAKVGTWA